MKDILTSEGFASDLGSNTSIDGNNVFSHFLGGIINMVAMTDRNNAPSAIKKAGELAEKFHMALTCGPAHGSYWRSQKVAQDIATTLKAVAQQVIPPLAASRP